MDRLILPSAVLSRVPELASGWDGLTMKSDRVSFAPLSPEPIGGRAGRPAESVLDMPAGAVTMWGPSG